MCAPMEKIQNKTALQLLQDYGNINQIPISLRQIALNIGISVLPMDFTKFNSQVNGKKISGLVMSNHNNAVIYYDKNDTPENQRFTVARELGHISQHLANQDPDDCVYIDYRTGGSTENEKEKQANTFAGQLLIPLQKLKEVYLKTLFPSSSNLAKVFGVSSNVMEERLNHLKVSHFTKDGDPVVYE